MEGCIDYRYAILMYFFNALDSASTYSPPSPPPSALSEPSPVLNASLSFDPGSVTNAASGAVSVAMVTSWSEPATPNGVITGYSVMVIQSPDGDIVFSDGSISANVTSLSVSMVTVTPNDAYFATVRVTNGGGFNEVNTSLVVAPEGGKGSRDS